MGVRDFGILGGCIANCYDDDSILSFALIPVYWFILICFCNNTSKRANSFFFELGPLKPSSFS
jgi:hypothetical protein